MFKHIKFFFGFLNEVFHGKGDKYYQSDEARRAFAKSLFSISDKLFFAPIVPLLTLAFKDTEHFGFQLCIAGIFLIAAIWMRHQGLLIIDEINNKKKLQKRIVGK